MTTGQLKLDELGGTTQLVEVVRETPKRFRIRALSVTTIWSKHYTRAIGAGEIALVKKDRLLADASHEPATHEVGAR